MSMNKFSERRCKTLFSSVKAGKNIHVNVKQHHRLKINAESAV